MTEEVPVEPDKPKHDAAWSRSPLARLSRSVIQAGLMIPLVRFLTPVRVLWRENLGSINCPVVFVANHQSHMDTPVLLTALGPRLRKRLLVAAAADYFYKNRLSGAAVSLALGTVPFVRRQGSSRQSLDQLKVLMRQGWSVLIFPAGTRGDQGGFKKGFSFLAVDTVSPVIPLCLHGARETLPKGTFVPIPAGIVVGVGEAIAPGSDYDALVAATEQAFAALAQRVHDETAGWGDATPGSAESEGDG